MLDFAMSYWNKISHRKLFIKKEIWMKAGEDYINKERRFKKAYSNY